jgi:ABC-2 type transport system ATP-binding protein
MAAIELENISKKFKTKGKVIWALKKVNLEINKGEIFGLLGPNGAGKTTLINIILTILIPDEGRVKIFGRNPFVDKEILQEVNFVPMERPYSHLSVKDFLTCYARLYRVNLKEVEYLLRKLRLKSLEKKECWMLSTGELSRVALAKALLNKPSLLILDEPTFGLDPKAKEEVRTLLKRLNRNCVTIFFASHDVMEVERLATRIAFIREGEILDVRKKKEIIEKFRSVEKYWLRLGK